MPQDTIETADHVIPEGSGDPMAELSALPADLPSFDPNAEPAPEGDPAPDPTPESDPVPAPEPEVKPVPKAKKDDVAPPPAPAKPAKPSGARVYDVKDTKLANMLRHMSNEAYAHFYPLAKKLEAGELLTQEQVQERIAAREAELAAEREAEVTAARFIDHEEGYTLTPEYREVAGTVSRLESELEFWQEQLANALENKPVRQLVIDKEGNLTVSKQEYKGGPQAAAIIQAKLSKGHALLLGQQQRLQSLPKQHKESYAKFNQELQSYDRQLFGDPTKYSDGFKKGYEENLKQMPSALRARPEVQSLAKAVTLLGAMVSKEKQLTAEIEKLRAQVAGRRAASPTADEVDGAHGVADGSDIDASVAALRNMERAGY